MMLRLPGCLLALLLLFIFPAQAVDIYVSLTGSDRNDGSKEKPYGSIAAALRKARELRRLKDPGIRDGVHIILAGGRFQLEETLFIRAEDAGTANSPTVIEAAANAVPILSGGQNLVGWRKLTTDRPGLQASAKGKVWVSAVPAIAGRSFEFRQLWINGKKAIRAKSENGSLMNRILSWNKMDQSCWIPTPKNIPKADVNGMEMFIHQWWAIAILRVKKMLVHGDSTQLFFHQPESKIQSEHPWPAPWISKETGNSAFFLANALEFLDEPGEWWLDMAKQQIYYWPRAGEDMARADAIVPKLETLIHIEGNGTQPVSHVSFKGLSFQHTGWLRPSHFGHVPHQAGMYMTEAYKLRPPGTAEKSTLDNQAWIGRPAAAIKASFASNLAFENCRLEHMASTGIDVHLGVSNNLLRGNLFKDIGGTAILAGEYSNEFTEIHLPYNPRGQGFVCDSLVVSNNLITDATNEDWSCAGIGLGYTKNSLIENNEVENVSYTGISMGWGWSAADNVMLNNKILRNKIHHYGKHNYDCAGIYTLSAQKGSVISENYIDSIYKAPYAHLPSHWFYIYTDEGSSFFTVTNNWTPSEKYLQNANGPGNQWSNNGPQVNVSVKARAGLEPAYVRLTQEKTSYLQEQALNKEHNEVIELIVSPSQSLDVQKLKLLLHQNKIDSSAVYHWNNHYVIFAKVQDVGVMQGRLHNQFPQAQVKVYHDLFYEFNRGYCKDTTSVAEWDHVLLTTDLADDPKSQQEYLQYHATQFEKWPELAKGFCNASFQQLLIYKNQQQLVLVISIPKGQSLDKLNPKTSENNPRVDEWNKLMSKYQKGIAGTKKGETWVLLSKAAP